MNVAGRGGRAPRFALPHPPSRLTGGSASTMPRTCC
uniref:Uncharacterized protein n=1 Tax=Arundo donax TaxID=35708 RepID=A0A0A8YJV7_ARUDO